MSKVSQENVKYYESRIRSILVFQPDASLRDIQKALEDSKEAPLHLQLNYVGKLRNRVIAERMHRNDRLTLKARLSAIQDKHKAVTMRLWREAMNPASPAVARIMALDKLMKGELELLQSEMDAGLYERKLGTIEIQPKLPREKAPPETLGPIILALQNYGIVDRQKPETLDEPAPSSPALNSGS